MAERTEEAEAEAEGGVDPNSPAVGIAIGLRRGGGGKKADPQLDTFLVEQTDLVRIQKEHLHEQRQVVLARLLLGRWKDRVTLALQAMTALVGVLIAAAVGVMAWQAHGDHGLVIAPFSVPLDLAARGLTGQVVAARVLDRLSDLQAQTVSARPASTYANDWGHDIKVEIPETGVSVGELNRWLREWLGSETRVTGEVVRTASGLQVTARAGDAAGLTVQGPEADMDALIGQAAESLYRQSQPYRYAVYLASHGRRDEASAAFAALARSGGAEDRPWAYAGWASIAQQEGRHYDAIRMARASMALNPTIHPAYETLGLSSDVVGIWSAGNDNPRRELALIRSGRAIGFPRDQIAVRTRFLEAVQAFYRSDFLSAATLIRTVTSFDIEGRSAGYAPQHLRARALASLHEVTAAEQFEAGPLDTNSYQAIAARGATLGDWAEVARRLEHGRQDPALAGDAQRTVVMPLLAQAYAHLGRLQEAKTLASGTPLDCYRCLVVRGEVATLERDWTAADRWYAELDRQSPNLSPAEWAKSLLERGDIDGAIAKATEAHKRSGGFADPLELWGEALMRKGDFQSAAAKFAEADRHAPRWGRNHLLWGEALMLSGRLQEARNQYQVANSLDLGKPERAALDVLLARTASGPLHG